MANLKRNMIELVKEVKEGEVITEKHWTPVFIPMTVVYEAMDLMEVSDQDDVTEREAIDKLMDFIANKIYKGEFTKDELANGLHAPDAITILRDQVMFIAQGEQTDETKNFLEKGKKN